MEICARVVRRRARYCTRFDFSCFYSRSQEDDIVPCGDGESSQLMLYNFHNANAALNRTDKWLHPEKVNFSLFRMYVESSPDSKKKNIHGSFHKLLKQYVDGQSSSPDSKSI